MNPITILRTYILFNSKVYRSILFCSFILAFVQNGYSQNGLLVIKNKTTGEEKILKEGKRMYVSNKNSKYSWGRLKFECDSDKVKKSAAIILSNDTIMLEDIKVLRTQSLFARIMGVTFFLGANVCYAYWLTHDLSEDEDARMYLPLLLPANAVIVPVSFFILSSGRKYNSKKWDFYVMQKK